MINALLALCLLPFASAATRPRPEPLPESAWAPPAPTQRTLSAAAGGMPVYIVEDHETPLWQVRRVLPRGGWSDPAGRPGTADAALSMLLEGTTSKSAEEIAVAARRLGADLSAGASADAGSITVSGITRTMPEAIALWAEVVRTPSFPESAWAREQTRRATDAASRLERPDVLARQVAGRLFYGETYRGLYDTPDTWKATSVADLRTWYTANVVPDGAFLLVGGDVDPDAVTALLESAFAGFSGAAPAGTVPAPAPGSGNKALFLIDNPGAPQSVVSAGALVNVAAPTIEALRVANDLLGGSFTSRINSNLREAKGWTYGARCSFDDERYGAASWVCSSSIRTDATADAVAELQREITEAVTTRPPTDEEVTFYRSSALLGLPGSYETTGALLDTVAANRLYGRPETWLAQRTKAIAAVEASSARAALTATIDPSALTWLVVGDAATVEPALVAKGWLVQRIDRDGKPLP